MECLDQIDIERRKMQAFKDRTLPAMDALSFAPPTVTSLMPRSGGSSFVRV